MAPAASITDVCQHRAAHGALVVRLVHVPPAAATDDSNTITHENAAARPSPRSYKYRKVPQEHGRARTAARHKLNTHTK
jgi:hypothetical protein